MKIFIKIGMASILLILFFFFAFGNKVFPAFIEMEVKDVRIDVLGQNPVVILVDKGGKKALPIWIGVLEAGAIERELKNIQSPRPMTHDLFHSVLNKMEVKIKDVKIVELKDYTYYAILSLKLNKEIVDIDARPSDAIILALKSKSPIYVSEKIINQQAIAITKKEVFGERYGIRVQELTPTLASHFNYEGKIGVLISDVIPGSIGEKSGLKPGDIITKINLKEISSVKEFEDTFDHLQAESSIQIQIFRDNRYKDLKIQTKQ